MTTRSLWQKARRHLLSCICGDLPHSAQIFYLPSDSPEERDLYLSILLPRTSLRQRLVSAWRLLFDRISPYGDTAEIILRPEDVPPLIDFLEGYLAGFDDRTGGV